ncbi:hypothetical protein [Brevibacillus gelatini]|nr:hypothetical protein [Brevibacillus gelatini]
MANINLTKNELYALLYVLQSEDLPTKKGTEQDFMNAKLKLMSAYTFAKD